jgi:hypothetical protein
MRTTCVVVSAGIVLDADRTEAVADLSTRCYGLRHDQASTSENDNVDHARRVALKNPSEQPLEQHKNDQAADNHARSEEAPHEGA